MARKNSEQPIRKGELLRLSEFLIRTGMKHHAWTTAKTQAEQLGVKFDLRHGRRCFVDCDRWIEFLQRQSDPVTS